MKKDKIICVFGGSGFIGQHVVQDLARAGFRVKIATRVPESAYELKTYGDIGQISPVICDYTDKASLDAVVEGCDVVINLIGVLYQKRKSTFMRVHRDLPEALATACAAKGVSKFIHVSALGVDKSASKYAKSKLAGEEAVLKAYPRATILRPSVVFGAGDNFFNMFAKMATFFPALPLIGGGTTKFQPVYVGDIAQAALNVVKDNGNEFATKTYQLAGPEVVTFKEIYQILLKEVNRDRMLVSIPWPIAKIQGAFISLMPKPLLTYDQVVSLKTDNVKDDDALGLKDLNIEPTAMGSILPRYLSNFKKGGPFSEKNQAA